MKTNNLIFKNNTRLAIIITAIVIFNTGSVMANTLSKLKELKSSTVPVSATLFYTAENRPLKIFYFPGTGTQNALIIGGMHGSELSSIELAEEVISQLSTGKKPVCNVWIIPCLFPDNAARARHFSEQIGSILNIGRTTSGFPVDPNRQMPSPGNYFSAGSPVDHQGRPIEQENQFLLNIIQDLKPDRIAALHAIRNTSLGGIYADPRTDCKGVALGFEKDSLLAIAMAVSILHNGGRADGNRLLSRPTALYHTDPTIARKGNVQKRSSHGSGQPAKIGHGISLGTWASTAVCHEQPDLHREAATVLTIEFPGSKRPNDYSTEPETLHCKNNIRSYANAITDIFLVVINVGSDMTRVFPQWTNRSLKKVGV